MASRRGPKKYNGPSPPPSSPFPPGVYLTKKEKEDMLKPLIFPNSERRFKWFTYILCGSLVGYLVFYHDWGDHEHCFQPFRRYCRSLVSSFYHIDEEDKDYVEERKKKLAAKLQESIEKETKLAEELKANPPRVFSNPQKGGFNRIDLDPEELKR